MLLGAFAALSVIVGISVCVSAGAFLDLTWLWLLPVTAIGCLLVLVLLAFGFLMILCKRVDQDVPQEDDDPLYRKVTDLYIQSALPMLKIRVQKNGLEKMPKDGRFLLVCNHCNNSDPIILLNVLRKFQLAFISKRENDKLFVLGPFLRRMGCQPINRENDREALKTILTCINIIQDDRMSVGVFPEGYIHGDNLLHPFRHGVFKIAQRTGVPIVVCTLRGTQHVLKNAVKGKPSSVQMHLVGVIEDVKGRNTVELGEQAYEMMARDLGEELVLPR